MYAESAHCNFKLAQRTYDELISLNHLLDSKVPQQLIAMTYSQISVMYFARNEYNFSHKWSGLAMRMLKVSAPPR